MKEEDRQKHIAVIGAPGAMAALIERRRKVAAPDEVEEQGEAIEPSESNPQR